MLKGPPSDAYDQKDMKLTIYCFENLERKLPTSHVMNERTLCNKFKRNLFI